MKTQTAIFTLVLILWIFVAVVPVTAQGPIPPTPPPTPPGWMNRDPYGGVLLPVAPGQYLLPTETCFTCQVQADRDIWVYSAPNWYGIIVPVQTIPGGTILIVHAVTIDFWAIAEGPWTGYFIDRSQTTKL